MPETAEEAVATVLKAYRLTLELEHREGMKIFDAPEKGFIAALHELGYEVRRRGETSTG